MILSQPLQSRRLRLRTAEPEDAAFVLQLRLDPELGRYLKPVDPCIEKQKKWIQTKKEVPLDYHMVIEDLAGNPLGVIALYAIKEDKSFDWGRWVISRDAPFYAAHESMVLLYDFAFRKLALEEAYFEVRKQNERVLSFHKNYGALLKKTDDDYHWFSYTRYKFENDVGMQNIIKTFVH